MSRRPRVLFLLSETERRTFLPPAVAARIDSLPIDAVWIHDCAGVDEARLRREAPEVLVTAWASPVLPEAWLVEPGCPLRYICHLPGSVKHRVPRGFIERGGIVSNWGSQAADAVAEHALLLALSALRNAARWRSVIDQPRAPAAAPLALGTRTLHRRKVGIHGFGAVARSLVSLLRPFNVDLLAWSAGAPESLFASAGVRRAASLAELAAHSEVFFECESLTPASEGCIDADLLARLPDGAVFVNVGRGHLADEAALLREASSGRIRLALDVVRDEPLASANPLCALPDAILSPHIAGPTPDQYPRLGEFGIDNLERYLRGESPESRVTLEIYDRST
jgi:Phosphoglycerate dehydrogenase and related dehydrogenases